MLNNELRLETATKVLAVLLQDTLRPDKFNVHYSGKNSYSQTVKQAVEIADSLIEEIYGDNK